MKTLKIVLILLFPGLLFSQSNHLSTISRISSMYEINDGDLICIIFINVGECDKCYNNTLKLTQFLIDSVDSFHIKPILGVNVKRDKDLQMLKEKLLWNIPAIAKSYVIKDEYGLGIMDYFLLIDHSGKELYRVNVNDLEKNFNIELNNLIRIVKIEIREFD